MRVDLDERRAARAEASGEAERDPFVIVAGGEEFVLRTHPPFGWLEELGVFAERQSSPDKGVRATALATLARAVAMLFQPGDYERFRASGVDEEDIYILVEEVTTYYTGADLGESRASGASSSKRSGRSKPTSPGSTASTSRAPASDQTRSASVGS